MDAKRNRRGFLKNSAALATGLTVGAVRPASGQTPVSEATAKDIKELIAYGERSRFETATRVSVGGRPSPDSFGLTFHVLAPLQDSVGIITPSSLFYTATHRGAFVPDIDPREHRLMIHGMVDRPLTFTLDELKRLPYVSSIPLAKAMDDCLVCYGMNGEALRPQQGYPLRLMVPGFEGIYQIKYLRRIKVVDRYYMTYVDYGHINPDPKVAALTHQIGPKSVITFPSGGQQLPGPGFYDISGLAWSGGGAIRKVEVSTDGGKRWRNAE